MKPLHVVHVSVSCIRSSIHANDGSTISVYTLYMVSSLLLLSVHVGKTPVIEIPSTTQNKPVHVLPRLLNGISDNR